MKTFRVQFVDDIDANTEEEARAILLDYLENCSRVKDVSVFGFEEIEHKDYQTH
jgi:hypothetical protein